MEFLSVKIPRSKGKFVRLLKAGKMKDGDYGATDAEVIGNALEFAAERMREFIDWRKRGSADSILAFAGAWKMSDKEADELISELRKWRAMERSSA